jgi:ketopantoate reductase
MELDEKMNLSEAAKNQNILYIYGAGAVGLAVAADALLAGPEPAQGATKKSAQDIEIIYITAKNQLKSFRVASPTAGIRFEHPMSCSRVGDLSRILDGHVQSASPNELEAPGQRRLQIQIAVTTPPQHMDKSVNEILDWVTANREAVTQKNLLIQMLVLCNGLLEGTTWERAISANRVIPNFSTVRCIVVAGFAKEISEGGGHALVTHTAGREIHWGAVAGTSHILPPALHGSLFDLIHDDDIRNLELQKFFTNAVLGWWIGNNAKNNSALTAILSQEQALVLASEFCQA